MKKKIIVLGRGNAGCFTALHFSHYLPDCTVELIYDPDVPPEKVGQASLLEAPELLWKALGINWYDNPINATNKLGILYENWGKKNKYIFHGFNFKSTGMHYDPKKLQEVILKCGLFKVTRKHISDPHKLDADFIFDCRGKKINDYSKYHVLDNPLNAVILGQSNESDPRQLWTRAVATPDGWTFVIPNTQNTTSYGYLYNDTITSLKEATANFKKIFKLAKHNYYLGDKVNNFKFKNYLAKEPIQDNVILSGNRLFFLEPLESTAVGAYLQWARFCYDYIVGAATKETTVSLFKDNIRKIQNFIYWHYINGSAYNTPFWKKASKYKIKDKEFHSILSSAKKLSTWKSIHEANRLYGQWLPDSFKIWQDGINVQKR